MQEKVMTALESWVRTRFAIPADDHGFGPQAPLFELGYIDSLGYVELIAFIGDELGVELPDDAVISDDFSTLAGIAKLVTARLPAGSLARSTHAA